MFPDKFDRKFATVSLARSYLARNEKYSTSYLTRFKKNRSIRARKNSFEFRARKIEIKRELKERKRIKNCWKLQVDSAECLEYCGIKIKKCVKMNEVNEKRKNVSDNK